MRTSRWIALLLASCSPAPTPTVVSRPPAASVSASVSASAVASVAPSASASTSLEDGPVATIEPKDGVGIALGPGGHLGAWLSLGPFLLKESKDAKDGKAPVDVDAVHPIDETSVAPAFGVIVAGRVDVPVMKGKKLDKLDHWTTGDARWSVASSGDGPIDLDKAWPTLGRPALGYLAAKLRLPVSAKLNLLIGVDDGIVVYVDGKRMFSRDESRPLYVDQDVVPLSLAAGDHTLLLRLHQRDAGWAAMVRLADESLRAPLGVRAFLPGADASTAAELARSMSWVSLQRKPALDDGGSGWTLATRVRYPEGAPLGVSLEIKASLASVTPEGTTLATLVEERALGAVPIGKRATAELTATLATFGDGAAETTTLEQHDARMRVSIAGRVVEGAFYPKVEVRRAIARANTLLTKWKAEGAPSGLPSDVAATLSHQRDRLASFATKGDADVAAQSSDAAALSSLLDDAEAGRDPIASRAGIMRLAHIARADELPQPIAVYVPKGAMSAKARRFPLYVGLHGMNGGPLAMLRVFFGGDDENKTMFELDRSMKEPPPLDAFVIAPHAHGNAMFRQLGEDEVLDAIQWALARWPSIDPDRIYVTGFSMGGIGAASIPFHHPDLFAASQPLCGYHSYWIRRDVKGRPLRPWESPLVDERSNVSWIDNGARLPMWIVHGKWDTPVENSGVLIDAYEKHKYLIQHDHPDKGHDVWGWAYDQRGHVKWFSGKRRVAHPAQVHFRTTRPRWGDDAWAHVDALSVPMGFATIDAKVPAKGKLVVRTQDVAAMHFDRDAKLVGDGAVDIEVDKRKLSFAAGAPLEIHREDSGWSAGPLADPTRKRGHITGPIRDVWHEPLRFVVGEDDPREVLANRQVADALASIRWGTDVKYPLVADRDVDLAAPPDRSIVLVGSPRSNRVLRALADRLPITVISAGDPSAPRGAVKLGDRTIEGHELGAAFVVPHPLDPSKYLLVVAGVDALGTLRALSLPELLPDFVVWDEHVASARGQTLLSSGALRAAGFFDVHWALPKTFDDPLLEAARKSAKNEKDATAYLP